MKKINNNVNSMYDDMLIPIARVGGMRASFMTISMNVSKALLNL
ncbi:MAG: MCP four helix bundle domain-containing protein [Clostridium sp.]|nr:MCP four helix bundle domain-containing protein [Clostridium sp.]